MCGTLYEIDVPDLPHADEPHKVPGAFWKVILIKPKGESLKAAAFIIGQDTQRSEDYADMLTTIEMMQTRNWLTLFPGLPAALLTSQDAAWVASWKELN